MVADKYRGRVPKIDCSKPFDAVLLVLLDKRSFAPIEIWGAERNSVRKRLSAPGSKARNERGQWASRNSNRFPAPGESGHSLLGATSV